MTDLLPCPFCGMLPRAYGAQIMVDGECPESIDCDNGDCPITPSTGYLPLEDAIAAWNTRTPHAGAVKVKKLEFEQAAAGIWSSGLILGGEYRIKLVGGKGYQVSRGMLCVPDCAVWNETLDLAISAAQADYAARIMAAIEATPDPRDEVIARLVEAAENLRVKHEYIMRGRTYSMTHMQIVGQFDAALAAAKEVVE